LGEVDDRFFDRDQVFDLLLSIFKEVFMRRDLNNRILAGTVVLIAITAAATIYTSKVRAADEKYQLIEKWAQLPPGMQWGVMSAVDIDSHGTIYAFKRSEPGQKAGEMSSMVMVIDPHGKFLRSWGFRRPTGFAFYATVLYGLRTKRGTKYSSSAQMENF
jgi:hypothetical protein